MRRLVLLLLLAIAMLRAPGVLAQTGVELRIDSLEPGVSLPAYWFAAAAGASPRPAVLALHGCGGLGSHAGRLGPDPLRYVQILNAAGIGVLFTESFVPRGESSICSQKSHLRRITEEDRRLDVYGALNWLARQPGVDAARLAVVGWSHGGQTVLASADASSALVRAAGVQPAALVAFYPGCSKALNNAHYALSAPTLIMSGALDNWTLAAYCRELGERLAQQAAGPALRYIEYPGSYHGFDSHLPPRELSGIGSTRSGRAMRGGNALAREASARDMLAFLEAQFAK